MVQQDPILFYVLIPVYKTEKYIRPCLDSVLAQTYQNFRMIIVDDGTPDKAGQICDEYAKSDSRIHVIHKENQGLISARRAAISYVKKNCNETNAFFVFLDSDDTWKENALEVIAKAIAREKCDLLFYGIIRVREGVELKNGTTTDAAEEAIDQRRILYNRVYCDSAYNPLCRKAIRCELMEDTDYSGYYHISHSEDLLQSVPIYAKCKKVAFIPHLLYRYTINPESITQSFNVERYHVDTTVRELVWKVIDEEETMTQEDKEAYLARCGILLKKEILRVAGTKGSYKLIEAALDQIRDNAYYKMLMGTGNGGIVCRWVAKKCYRPLIVVAVLRKYAASVLRMLRRKP